MWKQVDEAKQETKDNFEKVDGRMFDIEIGSGEAKKKIADSEQECQELKGTVTYLQSHTMRNNLIFGNIEEEDNEKPERTEAITRKFMVEKLGIAKDIVDNMKLERVHRLKRKYPTTEKTKRIVCKFNLFKDRVMERKSSYKLKGTNFYVTEQFPPSVAAKRRVLVRKMREEKQKGNSAWLSYDTLYVNGRPVQDK